MLPGDGSEVIPTVDELGYDMVNADSALSESALFDSALSGSAPPDSELSDPEPPDSIVPDSVLENIDHGLL